MFKKNNEIVNGVLLLDKPANLSSNRALQQVKKIMNASKAGHTGTLDPFATGLLLCCFGSSTKLSNYFLNSDKSYIGSIKFGEETDSGDLTGNIINRTDLNNFKLNETIVKNTLNSFHGEIEQIPPIFSAIKRSGIPMYRYARLGIEIQVPSRKIFINKINLLSFTKQGIIIEISCSKGTYIRSLARDIGRKLGCLAHLSSLCRTRIHNLFLENAVTINHLKDSLHPKEFLINESEFINKK